MRIALLVISMFAFSPSFAEVQDRTMPCLKELKNDARFSLIADHVALDGQDVTDPRMLTDETKPSDLQKVALADWIDARSLCVNLTPIKTSVDLHLLFLSIVPDLYNDQTTFGEFNRKWQTLYEEAMKAPATTHDNAAAHRH